MSVLGWLLFFLCISGSQDQVVGAAYSSQLSEVGGEGATFGRQLQGEKLAPASERTGLHVCILLLVVF